METQKQLEERLHFFAREARSVRAAMGTRPLSVQQQDYDRALDEIESAEAELGIRATQRDDLARISSREVVAVARMQQRLEYEVMLRTGISNTMSTGTGSQGGYSVPALVIGDIIDALKLASPMRQVATLYSTTTGAPGSVPTSDGTAEVGEQLAENASASSADPSFGSASIPTYKTGSKIASVPLELLQDAAVDMGVFVDQRLADRIARSQNAKFTTGSGTSEPTGIVTAASSGKVGLTGQTTTIIYDDLVDLSESVDVANGKGWMMSQSMRKVVRKVKDSQGLPVWVPGIGGGPAELLGYPVTVNNDMASPAANAKTLLFGNFARYMIRDVRKIFLFRFADSAFLKQGQVGFLMFARAGGNLTDVNAVRYYQHSAT